MIHSRQVGKSEPFL